MTFKDKYEEEKRRRQMAERKAADALQRSDNWKMRTLDILSKVDTPDTSKTT